MTHFKKPVRHEDIVTEDQILFEMGVMYATGRDCEINVVEAHKWLNIAAIRGHKQAADLRSQLARTMSKTELASALHEARKWMIMH
ncbi:sel1 repeat family protein [Paenochrobactrum sp. BZR 588]|uniref:sel1 repeat family protein n=1 Tax=Paenochrobactrum TaxID=999488 RepID=UPI0035BC188E